MKKLLLVGLLLLTTLFIIFPAEVIKYVDPDATGTESGDDWTNAYTNLVDFMNLDIDAVSAGDWYHCWVRASSGTQSSS